MKAAIRAFLMILVAVGPAAANDTMAVGAAGGLVFLKSADVEILSEDLSVAPDAIRVRYEFRNRSAQPVDALIAFPLPDVDLAADVMMIPADGLPADNFVGFAVTVDGKAVTPTLDARAYVGEKEVTGLLKRHGVPLSGFQRRPSIEDAVAALPEAVRQDLLAQGVVGPGEVGDFAPKWTLKTAFTWTQRFPPQRTLVVEHRYVPVVGGNWILPEHLTSDRAWPNYCLDAGTRRAIAGLLKPSGAARVTLIDYVLKTGANWAGPIGRFRLTLDKGKPDRVMSVCLDGLKRTGATTWVWERENYFPTSDLRVMLVERSQAD